MHFEWDDNKNRANSIKHGLDFRDAAQVFQGTTLTSEDNRRDYGEPRFISLGMLEDIAVVIVYTRRFDKIRIISMRRAKTKERKLYEQTVFFGPGPSAGHEG